jgi:hypothetical protein
MPNVTRPAQPFMPPEAATEYLLNQWGIRRSVQSLATYRCRSRGGGPRYRKAGRDVLYGPDDLDAYADALLRGATKPRGGDA